MKKVFKYDLYLYPTEWIISFPVNSQICFPAAIFFRFTLYLLYILDLLYINDCKWKKKLLRTHIRAITTIFFFLELKRNASFLVCSVSAPEKKLRTNRYLTCG